MPGKYSHDITIKANLKGLDNIKIPNAPIFKPLTTAIQKQFKQASNELQSNLNLVIDILAPFSQIKQRAKLAEKGSIITGDLDRSITIQKSENHASIGTTLFYAQYVEEGRGPVHAKNKPFLVFKIPGVGWIKTKSVGPAAPRYYLKESAQLLEKEIDDVMADVMESFGEGFT